MFAYTGDIELAANAEEQEARIKSGRYVDSETLGKRIDEYYA